MPHLRLAAPFALLVSALPLIAQDWRAGYPPAEPGARNGTRMAFDAARNELVLFGGQSPTATLLADTHVWNGTTWTPRSPAASPIARQNHEMCYDSVRQRVVLWGGLAGVAMLTDTWEWNGATWSQVVTPAFPSGRIGANLVFDGSRSLLFGGNGTGGARNDLWSFNGTAWTQLAPATVPPARYYHAMASNGAGEVIVFGGFQSGVGYGNTTWRFDGTNWSQQAPTTSPSARGASPMVWDPVHSRYLLWGGTDSFFTAYEDTWAFAGGQWTQLPTTRSPAGRSRSGVAWYGPQQRFVLYGGNYVQMGDLRATPMWEFGSDLASFVRWGPSVCPSIDPPVLRAVNQPAIGQTFQANVESFSWVHGFVLVGLSTTAWNGGTLPFDLAVYGTWPNCMLRVSPDSSSYLGFGLATPWSLAIPNDLGLVGTEFHLQGFTFGAGNFPTNLSTANAATLVVGRS